MKSVDDVALEAVSDEAMELSVVVLAVLGIVDKVGSLDLAEEVLGVAMDILVEVIL